MKKTNILNNDFTYELLDENQHVADLREKLANLYASPFSDIRWWELRDASLVKRGYYKLFYYEQNELKHIILFKYTIKAKNKIFVLNREINISVENMENICQILFHEFSKVQQIIFEKLYHQEFNQLQKTTFERVSNDVIFLDLPNSFDGYLKTFPKSKRQKMKLLMKHMERDFPDLKVQFFEKSDICIDQIADVVYLNRKRMKGKGIISKLNDTECKILHQYAAASGHGMLCIMTIGDKTIGGSIISVFGKFAYAHVLTHDSFYNHYCPGIVVLLNFTRYLIDEKHVQFIHLLNGTQVYKFRYGGVNHDLYTVHVFRNKNISFFWGKMMSAIKNSYKNFKQFINNNQPLYRLYIQMNKLKMKMMNLFNSKKNTNENSVI